MGQRPAQRQDTAAAAASSCTECHPALSRRKHSPPGFVIDKDVMVPLHLLSSMARLANRLMDKPNGPLNQCVSLPLQHDKLLSI